MIFKQFNKYKIFILFILLLLYINYISLSFSLMNEDLLHENKEASLNNGILESYSTYLGGNNIEFPHITNFDSLENIIMVGITYSDNFPIKNAFQNNMKGNSDIFITKFSVDGSLIFSTFLGGIGVGDLGFEGADKAIIDKDDNIIISGRVTNSDFPMLNPFQDFIEGETDIFLSKFSPNGTLLFSTFFGGNKTESEIKLGIDNENCIILAGKTNSENLYCKNSYQSSFGGGDSDLFFCKWYPNGTPCFSTYIGGENYEEMKGMTIGINGCIHFTGVSDNGFPCKNAIQNTSLGGPNDAIIGSFDTYGSLIFSTYLGGNNEDIGYQIVENNENDIIVAGFTSSIDFPMLNNQWNFNGYCSFLLKFTINGSLIYSTSIGNFTVVGDERTSDLNIDKEDNIIIAGYTQSSELVTLNANQEVYGGGNKDIFITKFNSAGKPLFSTYLGGNEDEWNPSICFDKHNNIIISGCTSSQNFPLLEMYLGGTSDIFITKINKNGTFLLSTNIGGKGRDVISKLIKNESKFIISGSTSSDDYYIVNSYQDENKGITDCFLCVFEIDSDNDGLSDVIEVEIGTNPNFNDINLDLDSDGLPNLYEYENGLNITFNDAELDLDNDGMPNIYEYEYGLLVGEDDSQDDIDSDGLPNLYEYKNGLNILFNDAELDLDNDGILNIYEYENGLNITFNDAELDLDNDGMPNIYEYENGLNITFNDAELDLDNDGMPNIYEYENGLNITFNDAKKDNDGDGITNFDEYKAGTNPNSFFSFPINKLSTLHVLLLIFIYAIGCISFLAINQKLNNVKKNTFSKVRFQIKLDTLSSKIKVPKLITKNMLKLDKNLLITEEYVFERKLLEYNILKKCKEYEEPIPLPELVNNFKLSLNNIKQIINMLTLKFSDIGFLSNSGIYYPELFFSNKVKLLIESEIGYLSDFMEKFSLNEENIDYILYRGKKFYKDHYFYLNKTTTAYLILKELKKSTIYEKLNSRNGFNYHENSILQEADWIEILKENNIVVYNVENRMYTLDSLYVLAINNPERITKILIEVNDQIKSKSLNEEEIHFLHSLEDQLPIKSVKIPYKCDVHKKMVYKNKTVYVCKKCNSKMCLECLSINNIKINCKKCNEKMIEIPTVHMNLTLDNLNSMKELHFEKFLVEFFNTLGYKTENLPISGDHNVNIIAKKDGSRFGIQVKRNSIATKIGKDTIMKFKRGEQFYNCNRQRVITTSLFTKRAKEYAEKYDIELWDRFTLESKLKEYNRLLEKEALIKRYLEEKKEKLCIICSSTILKEHKYTKCPYCNSVAHIDHLKEWIRQKSICPVCRKEIDSDDLLQIST